MSRRIVGHGEHLTEGDAPAGAEELVEHLAVFVPFAGMFDAGGAPLVGPAGQRLAEVAGENHMGDLVRQDGIEDPLGRALDRHVPIEHFAAVEDEGGSAAGAAADLHGHHARLRPVGHRLAEPLDGQVVAIFFGHLGHLAGEVGVGRLDDEVGAALLRAHRDQQHGRQASSGTRRVPMEVSAHRVCRLLARARSVQATIDASFHALPRFPNGSGEMCATSVWRTGASRRDDW